MIELFSSCPRSDKIARSRFLDAVADVAVWSERAGCRGIVVPAGDAVVDPWMVAHTIVGHSTTLSPVIAVQPAYTHPFWLAKQISSFAFLHGRRVGVAVMGSDRAADDFGSSLHAALESDPPAKLAPPLAKGLRPFVLPPSSMIHIGVIAREEGDHAWALACSRFPCGRGRAGDGGPEWLTPMRDYDTGCPYLVGSYDAVASELERFLADGRRRFVVDVPVDPEELDHVQAAFARTPTLRLRARAMETAAS